MYLSTKDDDRVASTALIVNEKFGRNGSSKNE